MKVQVNKPVLALPVAVRGGWLAHFFVNSSSAALKAVPLNPKIYKVNHVQVVI
jgi:hypothetical protein